MRIKSCNSRPKGVASLEFVLVFPFLMAMVFGIFMAGRAGVASMHAAVAARNTTWQNRPNSDPGKPLDLSWDPMQGQVKGASSQDYNNPRWYGGALHPAQSQSRVLAATWDAGAVPFDVGEGDFLPHRRPLQLVMDNTSDFLFTSTHAMIEAFATAMDIGESPAVKPLAALSKAYNATIKLDGVLIQYGLDTWISPIASLMDNFLARLAFGPVADVLVAGASGSEGLVEASKGYPGSWDPGKLRGIIGGF